MKIIYIKGQCLFNKNKILQFTIIILCWQRHINEWLAIDDKLVKELSFGNIECNFSACNFVWTPEGEARFEFNIGACFTANECRRDRIIGDDIAKRSYQVTLDLPVQNAVFLKQILKRLRCVVITNSEVELP